MGDRLPAFVCALAFAIAARAVAAAPLAPPAGEPPPTADHTGIPR